MEVSFPNRLWIILRVLNSASVITGRACRRECGRKVRSAIRFCISSSAWDTWLYFSSWVPVLCSQLPATYLVWVSNLKPESRLLQTDIYHHCQLNHLLRLLFSILVGGFKILSIISVRKLGITGLPPTPSLLILHQLESPEISILSIFLKSVLSLNALFQICLITWLHCFKSS